MQSTIFENKDFVLIRKPHGIPSTFGKEESFLDVLKKNISEHTITWTPLSEILPAKLFQLASSRLSGFIEVYNLKSDVGYQTILRKQVDTFGQEHEYGLLNRLDNETAGFLYFAKNIDAFTRFKSLQKSNQVKKFYLAQIYGNLETLNHATGNIQHPPFAIDFPIMHHRSIPEKMIAIRDPKDIRLGRSRQHHVITEIEILHYDDKKNITTILATITRGIRHQIRVHLASTGNAILGDDLYGKKDRELHLRSIGFKTN